ncbi:hypothetical protein [Saliphagus infecundisoli]|uniref:Uncharacterized protein n=1 Tax=Saliphagus infecundisoli TaxID=1849069 RepID=A0ABD5QKK5_9EURY|nr:hypothetical protein [Saliphagus infecundisoli]
MGEDKSRINLVVNDERKAEWQEYQSENPEFSSLTDLIRSSVTRQIEGQYGASQSGESELKVSEAIDKIDRLSEQLNSVEGRLQNLENQANTNPEVDRLKGEIYDILPDEEPGSVPWQDKDRGLGQRASNPSVSDPEAESKHSAWQGTPEEIADALDEPHYLVVEALEKLCDDLISVRKAGNGGYYIDR